MADNRLADATSPYLRQHARNPVAWYPWGEEALTLARETDRPILLSIGYSACHWCHVMAHESFEDEETAALMNALFVNIKVDREERPDLDRIYQTAHQLLTHRPGGWPLTLFLTPDDHTPFFAGTYFPPEPRHDLPAFRDLLRNVATVHREQRSKIEHQNQSLLKALSFLNPAPSAVTSLDAEPLTLAVRRLAQNFDPKHGGFGRPPKFPHPERLKWLLHQAMNHPGPEQEPLLVPVQHTLSRMALGGIQDQLGGGFFRYAVDARWEIPHFEKMLYDNALLLPLYADLWQATGDRLFRITAERTAEWVIREMQSPQGGYYSSLDADSEGVEGGFYLWTREQVSTLLSREEYRRFAPHYGLEHPSNFEQHWHLYCEATGQQDEETRRLLRSARHKLQQAREARPRPGRDEKILTAWNGLMIGGMAHAGRLLGRAELLQSAQRAVDFIRTELWRDGRLLAVHAEGVSHLPAYLDDYAYLLDALLELLQARWHPEDLELAVRLADLLLEHFQDPDSGGFFFTADDHEQLIHRPKPFADDATPAGNGVAARALLLLGELLGEPRYRLAAEQTLRSAWAGIREFPDAHCTLLGALDLHLHPAEFIIIRGKQQEAERWLNRCQAVYVPHRFALAIPEQERNLPGLLAQKKATETTVAYLCRGATCQEPISRFDQLDQTLAETEMEAPRG